MVKHLGQFIRNIWTHRNFVRLLLYKTSIEIEAESLPCIINACQIDRNKHEVFVRVHKSLVWDKLVHLFFLSHTSKKWFISWDLGLYLDLLSPFKYWLLRNKLRGYLIFNVKFEKILDEFIVNLTWTICTRLWNTDSFNVTLNGKFLFFLLYF